MLNKVLQTGSFEDSCTETRNVILLGHTVAADLGILKKSKCGKFDIGTYPNIPILDTHSLAIRLHNYRKPPSLAELAERIGFEIPETRNLIAGNYANYTWKVICILAAQICYTQDGSVPIIGLTEEQERRRGNLKATAQVEVTQLQCSENIVDEKSYNKPLAWAAADHGEFMALEDMTLSW